MQNDYEAYLDFINSTPAYVKKEEVEVIRPKHMPTVDNKGDLAINKHKTKDTHPDFRGIVLVNGIKYWVNAWNNDFMYKDAEGNKEQGIKVGLRFDRYLG